MLDPYTSLGQDPKRSQEPSIDIELYSEGFFDGLCNLESTKPHINDYWQEYQLGLREHLCKQLGVEITESTAASSSKRFSHFINFSTPYTPSLKEWWFPYIYT